MSAVEVPDLQTDRFLRDSVTLSLTAAGLFFVAGLLQLVASLQRWVVFSGSRTLDEISAENHLFDYSFPLDPWENIGTAAQYFGASTLILALGVLTMALGVVTTPPDVVTMPTVAARHRIGAPAEIGLAILVAGSFGINGAHAFISGLTGAPSPLRHLGELSWVGIIGLIVLAARWLRKSWPAMVACVFLFASTPVGYLLAASEIAPIFAGGVSCDTTRWTETVVAASTATAGVAMLIAAGVAAQRRAARKL